MTIFGGRGHDVRSRRHRTTQDQLAVVAGYSWNRGHPSALIYLACGTMPSGLLRYAGRAEVQFASLEEKRAFGRRVADIRVKAHHPLIASPLPGTIVWLAPRLLAQVTHHGWTPGGLMRQVLVHEFVDVSEPPPPTREGPTMRGA